MAMKNKWCRFFCLLLAGVLLMAPALASQTRQERDKFTLGVTWVNGFSPMPENMTYTYHFVEQTTGDSYPLVVDAKADALPSGDKRIVLAQAEIQLPRYNSEDKPAVYLIDNQAAGYIQLEGLRYTVASSESQDAGERIPYFGRKRVLTQQINPSAAVVFEGAEPQPFDLTLEMLSWAQELDGGAGRAKHSATIHIDQVAPEGLDLIKLFSANAEDVMQFRHFAFSELAWDSLTIAGTNTYSLKVGEVPGLTSRVTGSVEDGFHILFSPAP